MTYITYRIDLPCSEWTVPFLYSPLVVAARAAVWCWGFEGQATLVVAGGRWPRARAPSTSRSHARASGLEFAQVQLYNLFRWHAITYVHFAFDEAAGRVKGLVNNLTLTCLNL